MRRVYDGELKSHRIAPRTLQRWDALWTSGGLRALVDGRSIKDRQGFDAIDPHPPAGPAGPTDRSPTTYESDGDHVISITSGEEGTALLPFRFLHAP